MNTEAIIEVCQQLKSEGKEPSVALIKARLTKPQPLPTVISGLKAWKNNPNHVVVSTPVVEEKNAPSLEERVEKLEQQVKDLNKVIEHLTKS